MPGEQDVPNEQEGIGGPYLGKYRGTVFNNIDPLQMGRIQVIVPDVSNIIPTSWAMPCLPIGGIQMGMFTVPPIGTGVWVEFERGDPDYPVWVGTYWGSPAEVPLLSHVTPPGLPGITLQTPLQNGVIITDLPPGGGVIIQTSTNAQIIMSSLGVSITNGQGASIAMVGPQVIINAGALVVT